MGKGQQEFGLYIRQNFTEQQRLKDPAMVRFWNQITLERLESLLKPSATLVDAGAGPNVSLERELVSRGVTYIPFDIRSNHINARRDTLSKLHEKDIFAHVANIRDPALPRDFADVFLMRFVLEHIPVVHWEEVLIRSMQHTRGSIVIMMHDWSTLTSTKHSQFMADFMEHSRLFAHKMGITLYPRNKLTNSVMRAADRGGWDSDHALQHFFSVSRPEGWYGDEFMIMTQAQATMSHGLLGDHELGTFFDKAATFFTVKAKKSSPVLFRPPDIVFAMIQRGNR